MTTKDGDVFDYHLDKDGDIILLVNGEPYLLYLEDLAKLVKLISKASKGCYQAKTGLLQ